MGASKAWLEWIPHKASPWEQVSWWISHVLSNFQSPNGTALTFHHSWFCKIKCMFRYRQHKSAYLSRVDPRHQPYLACRRKRHWNSPCLWSFLFICLRNLSNVDPWCCDLPLSITNHIPCNKQRETSSDEWIPWKKRAAPILSNFIIT